jgi:hypothetical protein
MYIEGRYIISHNLHFYSWTSTIGDASNDINQN